MDLTKARILIVDDNASNTLLLEALLKRNGFTDLVSTTDPLEAMSLYESFDPDLLLLDLQMPHLDGFAILRTLQDRVAERGYFPVLVLTADVTPEAKHRALKGGAKDFVTKPFDHAEVLLRVGNLLETRHLHQMLNTQNEQLEGQVQNRTRELDVARLETLQTLALAAEFRDDATHRHTERVADISVAIAESVGLDREFAELIKRAAPLHDIGKIGISDSILLKPGKLTADEFMVMQDHTNIGAEILSTTSTDVLRLGSEIALTHHERWDGGGYPAGCAGNEIPISGRIVSIADVFDALTHERPYKAAWSREEALAEIARERGKKFDPELADVFLELVAS
jgi:putative two-component system response regulator